MDGCGRSSSGRKYECMLFGTYNLLQWNYNTFPPVSESIINTMEMMEINTPDIH